MRPAPAVMPALVTPFDDDGELDLGAHAHNVAHLSSLGITGFVLGGSNGEGPYLDAGERSGLIETAREAAPDAHLMVGIMAETDRRAVRQLSECGGADAVLVLTPTTLVRNRSEYVRGFFERVAERSERPVFLYSVPPNTAYSLPVEVIEELAPHPNIVGMKDSSGDVSRLRQIIDATPDDFLLYSGSSPTATQAFTVGCHGIITGSVNYVPGLVLEMAERARSDPRSVEDMQRRLTEISRAIDAHGVPGVKAAAEAAGLRPGRPRLPLQPLDPEHRRELSDLI